MWIWLLIYDFANVLQASVAIAVFFSLGLRMISIGIDVAFKRKIADPSLLSDVDRKDPFLEIIPVLPPAKKKPRSRPAPPPPAPPSEAAIASFHFAAYQGDLLVLQTYLRQKQIVNSQQNGLTAIHQAISGLQVAAVECLIQAGHDVNVSSSNHLTPVHLACIEGSMPILKLLVEHGADIFALGSDGFSCAHMASARGHEEVLDFLLARGVSLYEKTNRGLTPALISKSSKSSLIKSLVITRVKSHVDYIKSHIFSLFRLKGLPVEVVCQILLFLVEPKMQNEFKPKSITCSGPPSVNDAAVSDNPTLSESERRTVAQTSISEVFAIWAQNT